MFSFYCVFFKGLTSLATVQGLFGTYHQNKGTEMTKGSHCSHSATQPQTGSWESNTRNPAQELPANRSHLARELGADGMRQFPTCARSCSAQGPLQAKPLCSPACSIPSQHSTQGRQSAISPVKPHNRLQPAEGGWINS